MIAWKEANMLLTTVNLDTIKKQVAEDFPQVSVQSSCALKYKTRYDTLVYLAIVDYIDLRLKEYKHVNAKALICGLQDWSRGQITYTDLLGKAKALIYNNAQKDKIKNVLIDNVYHSQKAQKQNIFKRGFQVIRDNFHEALFTEIE